MVSERRVARTAFAALVAGEAWLLALVLAGGARTPGYDHARQFISELGAGGAVDGWAVSWVGFLPIGVLFGAFCLASAWLGRRRPLAVAGWLFLALNAYAYANSAWFRCETACAGMSTAQAMHNLFGLLGYVGAIAGILMAGLSTRRTPASRLMPLGIACALLVLIGLGGLGLEHRGTFQRLAEAATTVFMLSWGWAQARGRV